MSAKSPMRLKPRKPVVRKLGLNEPLRIIISMRVEKEPETLAQETNAAPQRLRDPVG
jgi:hypothetical protein